MKGFFPCLALGFARLRRRPGRLIGMCLLPLLVLAAGLALPPGELDTPLEAGVCLPAGSPHSEALFARLNASDAQYVSFHRADAQKIHDQVAAGKWVCGFVLRDDFDARVAEPQPGPLADVMVTRAETMAPLLCEAFSAALYHIRAPALAARYAQENGLAAGAEPDALWETAGAEQAMTLRTVTVDGHAERPPQLGAAAARAACRGLAAVVLFLYALLLAAELDGARRETWFARVAALSGPFALRAGLAAAQMLPLSALAALSLALGEAFFTGSALKPADFASFLGYAVWMTGLALLLGYIPGARHALYAATPFAPAACLLLCPIFFDAARLFALAAPLSRLLPPTWLLRAFQGAAADGALIWGLGLACFAGAAALSKRPSP